MLALKSAPWMVASTAETAPLAVVAGANVLVAGTAIFGESESVAASMERLRANLNHLSQECQTVQMKASAEEHLCNLE